MKPRAEAVSRRYARALLDLALQKGDAPAVQRELDEVAGLLESQDELRSVLAHPALPVEKKKAIAGALFGGAASASLVGRLVHLLLDRQRIDALPTVARAYTRLWNAHRGIVEAEAVSATPLDAEANRALGEAVGKATGHEVALRTSVDQALLGGVLLRMEGRVYDGSVRGRLHALRDHLAGARAEE
jgi:F-type H+-transporting ATPase subunit delta